MDIGFQEIFLISVIALLVLGPERLPEAARSLALWLNRLKRSFNHIKSSIENEIDAEDIRQQIYNDNVLHALDNQPDAAADMFDHEYDDGETVEENFDHSANSCIDNDASNVDADNENR
jgi:Tat protein translocase TatB subunit